MIRNRNKMKIKIKMREKQTMIKKKYRGIKEKGKTNK